MPQSFDSVCLSLLRHRCILQHTWYTSWDLLPGERERDANNLCVNKLLIPFAKQKKKWVTCFKKMSPIHWESDHLLTLASISLRNSFWKLYITSEKCSVKIFCTCSGFRILMFLVRRGFRFVLRARIDAIPFFCRVARRRSVGKMYQCVLRWSRIFCFVYWNKLMQSIHVGDLCLKNLVWDVPSWLVHLLCCLTKKWKIF